MESVTGMVSYVSGFSILLPIIVLVLRLRKFSKHDYIIMSIVVSSGASDLLAFLLFRKAGSTIVAFNIQDIIQFVLVSWFYYEVIFKSARTELLHTGIVAYVVLLIVVTFYVQDFTQYQSWMWASSALIISIYGLVYMNYLIVRTPVYDPNIYSKLAFNAGIFLYFSFSICLFAIGEFVLTAVTPSIGKMIWSFHNVNNILRNLAFAVGFYLIRGSKTVAAPVSQT